MKLPNVNDFQCNPASADSVILTPGFFVVGVGTSRQTIAWLAGLTSEAQQTLGVTYESSDASIATVDVNGNVSGVSPGVAFISATYNGLSGYATVIVQPVVNGGYCTNEPVGTFLLLDTSLSMLSQPFDQVYSTPFTVAKVLAKALANALNTSKDVMGLLSFDISPEIILALSNDPPTIETAVTGVIPQILAYDYTEMPRAFDFALDRFKEPLTIVRKVLVMFTDGMNDPEMGSRRAQELIEKSLAFQARGGIVIVVGMNATGQTYRFLRSIATPGYFVNVLPNAVDAAKATLLSLPALYCAQSQSGSTPNYFPEDGGYWYDNLYDNLY